MQVILDTDRAVLLQGDALAVLARLAANSADALVTDPPAGIGFMGKEWDSDKGGRAEWIGWLASVMREALRVLKPGAHALVWAIPRTSHWTATALEDAGFEVRDVVMHLFGTGFPKSLDVGKAIDARGGNAHLAAEVGAALRKAREARGLTQAQADAKFCGGSTLWSWFEGRPRGYRMPVEQDFARIVAEWPELAPLAARIAAAERAFVGQKRSTKLAVAPGQGEDRSCVVLDVTEPATEQARGWSGWGTALKPGAEHWILARKPLDGTVAHSVLTWGTGALNVDGCRIDVDGEDDRRWPANVTVDETALAQISAQAGRDVSRCYYTAKTSKAERDLGCELLPVKSGGDMTDREEGSAGLKNPRAGAGRGGGARNFHPTVKPQALMRWLVRLITPPGGLVIDPFAGSGSTGVAALAERARFLGVELSEEYLPITKARIERALVDLEGTVQ